LKFAAKIGVRGWKKGIEKKEFAKKESYYT
jgi:hypothetical protein